METSASFPVGRCVALPVRNHITPGRTIGCALLALAGFGGLIVGVIGLTRLGSLQGWWSMRAFTHLSQTHTLIMIVTGGAGGTLLLGGAAAVLLRNAPPTPLHPVFSSEEKNCFCRGSHVTGGTDEVSPLAFGHNGWGFGYVGGDGDSAALTQFHNNYENGLSAMKSYTLEGLTRYFDTQMSQLREAREKIEVSELSFVQIVPLQGRIMLLTAQAGNTQVVVDMGNGEIRSTQPPLCDEQAITVQAFDITGAKRIIGFSAGIGAFLTHDAFREITSSTQTEQLYKALRTKITDSPCPSGNGIIRRNSQTGRSYFVLDLQPYNLRSDRIVEE